MKPKLKKKIQDAATLLNEVRKLAKEIEAEAEAAYKKTGETDRLAGWVFQRAFRFGEEIQNTYLDELDFELSRQTKKRRAK